MDELLHGERISGRFPDNSFLPRVSNERAGISRKVTSRAPSHGDNRDSNPLGSANQIKRLMQFDVDPF